MVNFSSFAYVYLPNSLVCLNYYFFLLGSAAFRAFDDSYFQCKGGWRSCDHRAFECAVQDNKEVSEEFAANTCK